MSEPLLTDRGTVYPSHCNHVGHMNVMWYVGKFDVDAEPRLAPLWARRFPGAE